MILFIAPWIAKLFSIDITKATKWARWFIIGLIFLIIFILGISLYSCFKKEPKIDQESINKINTANEIQRKQELQKVIEENQDVIKAVDERNTITELNELERNRQIQIKVAEADKKIEEAKRGGKDVTQEELKCILIPENCQ